MICLMLETTVVATLLLGVPKDAGAGLRTVHEELVCRPAAELDPRASAGETERVASTLPRRGELLRWRADAGDNLRLRIFAAESGTYDVSFFAVHGANGPTMSAKLWDDPLTRGGEAQLTLQSDTEPEIVAVRFDPVSLGPGHHFLELTLSGPGEVLLDCVALRRTGEPTPAPARDGAEGRPFLGVQIGETPEGGVVINSTVPGSAAAEAGLEAGDVIVSIDGEQMSAQDRLTDAILRRRPGDRVELALLREGEPLEMVVALGRWRRPWSATPAQVIEVLDVQPGQVIADIGCGSGWLSEAIAEKLGAGLVYAVEIDEGDIRRLRWGTLPNVVPVLSVPEDVSLPENSLDTAMLHDVASHVSQSVRPRFYASVARALKPEGRLVIFGPHGKARAMLDELRKYGFIPLDDDELAALSPEDLDGRLQDGIAFRHRPE